jgi:hypothetical protein
VNVNIDRTISLGKQKNVGPTALVNHLRQHDDKYQEYLAKKNVKLIDMTTQTCISSFFSTGMEAKIIFKYTQWIIEESMPFEVGSSALFHSMIHFLNKFVTIPDCKELLRIMDEKCCEVLKVLCQELSGNCFSLTTDHWTSLAMENYVAYTIHFINNFELKSYVLCCSKHDDEATAI